MTSLCAAARAAAYAGGHATRGALTRRRTPRGPKPMRLYEPEGEPRIYRIIRFRQGGRPRTVRNNVTLTEAQAHCSREDTHGVRGGVRWFDGYDYMPGCRPRGES